MLMSDMKIVYVVVIFIMVVVVIVVVVVVININKNKRGNGGSGWRVSRYSHLDDTKLRGRLAHSALVPTMSSRSASWSFTQLSIPAQTPVQNKSRGSGHDTGCLMPTHSQLRLIAFLHYYYFLYFFIFVRGKLCEIAGISLDMYVIYKKKKYLKKFINVLPSIFKHGFVHFFFYWCTKFVI